ncbi:MAG: HIT family protein [Bacteroidales bacterium]|jgi:histidine triad (HIT) family protein|nr:HIT family protein [Bacteroidales bacterium]
MASIFTKIINGEIPCYKVAENEHCLAFLDIMPRAKGHTLVVPKKEIDQLFDLSDADYCELMKFSKQIATAIKSAIPCKRVGVAVIGLDVPHAHIHLIPLETSDDINFQKPHLNVDAEEMKAIAKTISEKL